MKNILGLQKDVATIEEFLRNSIVNDIVIKLGLESKTPITLEGYKPGSFLFSGKSI